MGTFERRQWNPLNVRVTWDILFTFEELTTLLFRIEACLNSRHLIAPSDDPTDPTVFGSSILYWKGKYYGERLDYHQALSLGHWRRVASSGYILNKDNLIKLSPSKLPQVNTRPRRQPSVSSSVLVLLPGRLLFSQKGFSNVLRMNFEWLNPCSKIRTSNALSPWRLYMCAINLMWMHRPTKKKAKEKDESQLVQLFSSDVRVKI